MEGLSLRVVMHSVALRSVVLAGQSAPAGDELAVRGHVGHAQPTNALGSNGSAERPDGGFIREVLVIERLERPTED